jgi:hypothetical protein
MIRHRRLAQLRAQMRAQMRFGARFGAPVLLCRGLRPLQRLHEG